MATMNIKDPRVHELAGQLARLRGTSATAAVRSALEDAISRELAMRVDRRGSLASLQQRAAATSRDWLSDDDMYGADGAPR